MQPLVEVTFRVYRRDGQGPPRFDTFVLEMAEDETVLEGLLRIRDELDPSLAFRGACQQGFCGECALRINSSGRLACRSLVGKLAAPDKPISVEPLRHVPVVKDLVWDMQAFLWSKVEALHPWVAAENPPAAEHLVSPEVTADLQKVMSCYMCGLCDEGCTVIAVDDTFLGPAALTKAYRVIFDPRDVHRKEHIAEMQGPRGLWDCVHCFEANSHCPKGIEPTDRIMTLRDVASREGITHPRVARHHASFAASVKSSGWLDEGRLAIEQEGLTNIPGLLNLAPTALRALRRGKAPIPYLHAKRPGAERIRRIFEKVEENRP